jgi:hypothetical protein
MLDVLLMQVLEDNKQWAGVGCVLPVVVHLRDTLLFVYYILRAMGDVPLGFSEATELHRAIHNATYNKTTILPNQTC